MNAILDSDKEEKHISLVGVEADVISSYVSLLCKGRLQIDENRYTDIRKLRCFLSMIGSKIVVEMEPPAMECGARGHQTKSLTNVDQVQDKGSVTGVNNDEEIVDDINQSSQMLTILHNEVPPQRKRTVTVHTPNTPSPAIISSRGLSQARLLTEGAVSKIIVSRPAGSRDSTPISSDKSRVGNDVTPTVSEVGSGSDNDEDMDTVRDKRLADIKEENLEYEALLAPISNLDDDVEVEIVEINSPNAPTGLSTSHKKQAYPCRKCKRVLSNKGAWSKHILACHIKTKKIKKKKQLIIRKHFTCLRCQVRFASKSILIKHQKSCGVSGPLQGPFQCRYCSKTFNQSSGLSHHLRKLCSSLEGSKHAENGKLEMDVVKKNDPADNEGGDHNVDSEEGEHQVTDHEEQEDTLGDHVSCKECRGKLFTKEKFERHKEQTGHSGDIIKLPKNLTFEK